MAHKVESEPAKTIAEDLGGNVRELLARRQAAHDEARDYRRKGHLVPGSLSEEIAEIAGDLERALERYSANQSGE